MNEDTFWSDSHQGDDMFMIDRNTYNRLNQEIRSLTAINTQLREENERLKSMYDRTLASKQEMRRKFINLIARVQKQSWWSKILNKNVLTKYDSDLHI